MRHRFSVACMKFADFLELEQEELWQLRELEAGSERAVRSPEKSSNCIDIQYIIYSTTRLRDATAGG